MPLAAGDRSDSDATHSWRFNRCTERSFPASYCYTYLFWNGQRHCCHTVAPRHRRSSLSVSFVMELNQVAAVGPSSSLSRFL